MRRAPIQVEFQSFLFFGFHEEVYRVLSVPIRGKWSKRRIHVEARILANILILLLGSLYSV